MLSDIFLEQEAIWIVVGLFYVFDNVRALQGNKLILRETWNLKWDAQLPSRNLVFVNRQFVFLNLILPYCITIPLEWLTEAAPDPVLTRRADRTLRVAQRKIAALRCLSVVAFLAFLVEGPVITYAMGLTAALLQILPVYLGLLVVLLWSLLADRKFWRLSGAEVFAVVFGAAASPGYLINIARRMSWRCIDLDVDGAVYGLHRCSQKPREDFAAALRFALEELENDNIDNPPEQQRIIAYGSSLLP